MVQHSSQVIQVQHSSQVIQAQQLSNLIKKLHSNASGTTARRVQDQIENNGRINNADQNNHQEHNHSKNIDFISSAGSQTQLMMDVSLARLGEKHCKRRLRRLERLMLHHGARAGALGDEHARWRRPS